MSPSAKRLIQIKKRAIATMEAGASRCAVIVQMYERVLTSSSSKNFNAVLIMAIKAKKVNIKGLKLILTIIYICDTVKVFLEMPISGIWRLCAINQKHNKEAEMPTVKVTFSWFSSNPIFKDVLAALKKEIAERKILAPGWHRALKELPSWNGGEPITGNTEWGPHTRIKFEAPSLAKAVFASEALQCVLYNEFSQNPSTQHWIDFASTVFYYNGKTLPDFIADLEKVKSAAEEAQQDLKFTRRFFPSKKIQALRLSLQETNN